MVAGPRDAARLIGLFALALPGIAEAYRYNGPRTVRSDCAGQPSCKFVNPDFAAIAFKVTLPLRAETKIAVFQPINPIQRGGSIIHDVSLLASRDRDRIMLNIRRTYRRNNVFIAVDYPVTDPLQVGVSPNNYAVLDLTVYMSANQAWIESRQGITSLSRVWTIPMFFGFGPSTSGVWVDAFAPQARYFAVAKTNLLREINSNYASLEDYTPFLFRGGRVNAAGLLAAIDGSTR